MKLTSGTVYEHEDSGAVLVLSVHHVFEEYDLDANTGQLSTRVVRHTDDWDGYGPMPSSVRTTPVDEFRAMVGEPIRTVEFNNPAEETERSGPDDQR